jgi:hypothetical protein
MIDFDKVLTETRERLTPRYGGKGHISSNENWSRERFEEWMFLLGANDYADRNVKSFERRAKALEADMRAMLTALDEKNISELSGMDSAVRQIDTERVLFRLTALRNMLNGIIDAAIEVEKRV